MTRKTVKAERYDATGRAVENVEISVNIIDNRVFLFIQGEKTLKNFLLSADAWKELTNG